MTTRQTSKYGPMLFDASDYTTLLRRHATLRKAKDQLIRRVEYTQLITPGELLSAAIGQQYCFQSRGTPAFCSIPILLPSILSTSTPSPT